MVVAILGSVAAGDGAPCSSTLETTFVKAACAKGGQAEAKREMQKFIKAKGVNSCMSCHAKLGPSYALKADALDQFKKLGGS